jgi:hypothetical protein
MVTASQVAVAPSYIEAFATSMPVQHGRPGSGTRTDIAACPCVTSGLVRRVGSEELAALDQVIDRGRDVVTVGAGAYEAGAGSGAEILRGQRAQVALDLRARS